MSYIVRRCEMKTEDWKERCKRSDEEKARPKSKTDSSMSFFSEYSTSEVND